MKKIFNRILLVIVIIVTIFIFLFPLGAYWILTGKDYFTILIIEIFKYYEKNS